MSNELVRLNITLPSSLSKELSQFSGPRKRSQFIAEAIRLRINQLKKKNLERSLEEGYRETRKEAMDIAKEFAPADIGSWDEY